MEYVVRISVKGRGGLTGRCFKFTSQVKPRILILTSLFQAIYKKVILVIKRRESCIDGKYNSIFLSNAK